LDLAWRLAALVQLAGLIVGGVGLSLMVAGLAPVWKRIEMLNDLVLMLIMFFSGAAMRLEVMPSWAQPITSSLFITHAVAGLRTVMLDGGSLALGGTGGMVWLFATATAVYRRGSRVQGLRTHCPAARRPSALLRWECEADGRALDLARCLPLRHARCGHPAQPALLKAYDPERSHAVQSVLLEHGLEMISGSDVAA